MGVVERERHVLDDRRLHRGHGASVYMRQCDVQLLCSLLHVEFEPVHVDEAALVHGNDLIR